MPHISVNAEDKGAKEVAPGAEVDTNCTDKNCINNADFIINVNDFSPGLEVEKDKTTQETIDKSLGKIIQTMMVALASLSVLIMSIGAGYMIFHHGQDDLLSRGKSIFNAGIIAMVVALMSYYIVNLLQGILL